ncbi:hypothetical protein FSP39_015321 [Pinctada imbricata]|uniref:Peptidase aspartic putative domain-containing protein n=1 Tax=Pinctada imbricata TaxID=66713 RepID=A0AA89C7R0_PINIB|nr:hypothetical protein FSP39_015321 [Pinctada imbricata]
MPVEFDLESTDGKTRSRISAFTTNRVTGNMCAINWNKHKEQWSHLSDIKFPIQGKCPNVDMLLGIDFADLHYSIRDIRRKSNEPIARLTPLGWTCIGSPNIMMGTGNSTHYIRTYFTNKTDAHSEIDDLVRKFWEIEEIKGDSNCINLSTDEHIAVSKVRKSMNFSDGRYEVEIPWREDRRILPRNFDMAFKRLERTERRLQRNPEIAKGYTECIQKYTEKGYVRKVPEIEERPNEEWFLPHFAVVKPDRSTTKTRIVFDASAKFARISLNDVIHQGPKLQRELFDVLLRFRKRPVAIACDIAEMYLRINVAPKDRSCQRFLWRDLNQNKKPEVYEFQSVVFGINSSPFQAQFVSQEHARKHENELPRAVETVLKSTYMDESLDSVETEEDGITLYNQLSDLWRRAGMYARKWLSNSKSVLKEVPETDRALEVDLDGGYLPSVKTLGLVWSADPDQFSFNANPVDENLEITKRNFLKKIAMLFDPLGFVTPYTIRAKFLLQEMWACGYDWDATLSNELKLKAHTWLKELHDLRKVAVDRCIRERESDFVVSESFHTFVYASQDVYGAVVYARYEYSDSSVSTRMIAAKGRVAPLKSISIPRMELLGAILGLRLTCAISKALEIDMKHVTYWSDSMNVLYWIRGCSRSYKTFVANRVSEIHDHSEPVQWRYVPTEENPADIASRGTTVEKLVEEIKWWYGPSFLREPEQTWPKNKIEKSDSPQNEIKKGKTIPDITLVATFSPFQPETVIDSKRENFYTRMHGFSDLLKTVKKQRVKERAENCQ